MHNINLALLGPITVVCLLFLIGMVFYTGCTLILISSASLLLLFDLMVGAFGIGVVHAHVFFISV